MNFNAIVNLVDVGELTDEQRTQLRQLLVMRQGQLQKALKDVEKGINKLKLKPKKKKSAKRKR